MRLSRSAMRCALLLLTSCTPNEPIKPPTESPPAGITTATATAPLPAMRYADSVANEAVVTPAAERKAKLLQLSPELDRLFQKDLDEHHYPGLGVGIVLDGEMVYAKGFGLRNIEAKAPFDADSVFRIASVSKSFTAMAILKLRDEGKLSLDEPAARYYPPLGKLAYPTRDSPPITVRHLLTHGSGLPEDNAWLDAARERSPAELQQLIESGMTFSRAPNTQFEYSNTGFGILGQIVASVAKMPAREYIRKEIWTPLGMRQSYWEREEIPEGKLVVGYRGRDGFFGKDTTHNAAAIERLGVMDTAGGVYTTVRDLARFMAFHLSAWPPRSAPETGPLRRSSAREMQLGERPATLADMPPVLLPNQPMRFVNRQGNEPNLYVFSYGYGLWSAKTCDDDFRIEHLGGLPGYATTMQFYPTRGYGIIVFINDERVHSNAITEEANKLLRKAGVIDVLPPAPVPALDAAQNEVEALYAKFDAARAQRLFDPTFWNYSTVESFDGRIDALRKAHGACQRDGTLKVRSTTRGSFHLRCERGEINFAVVLSPEAKPRLQILLWDETLPPGPVLEQRGAAIVSLINRYDEAAARKSFAPSLDLKASRKQLLRLAVDHGSCKLDKTLNSDGKTNASFRLECSDGPVEITLSIDEKTQLVTQLASAPPASAAYCAP